MGKPDRSDNGTLVRSRANYDFALFQKWIRQNFIFPSIEHYPLRRSITKLLHSFANI